MLFTDFVFVNCVVEIVKIFAREGKLDYSIIWKSLCIIHMHDLYDNEITYSRDSIISYADAKLTPAR